jgi:GntR family transcriptional regulator
LFYNARVKIRLDPSSPIPLYHQLAEALRAQVATGILAPGDYLPPLRQAAEEWGVNLHTVRHAYQELARSGLVRTTAPRGTVVVESAQATSANAEPEELIPRFTPEAREQQHVLTADEARRQPETDTRAAPDVAYVIECSTSQALDLARQVEERWHVRAKPWSLERAGEPPAGNLVATYFHYNDIRSRWPRRLAQVQFASIHPDPALATRVRAIDHQEARTTVILCEREAEMARKVAGDLATVLPPPAFEIRTMVAINPATALHVAGRNQPVLFAPRVWGTLGQAERADPRALEVRYLFDRAELDVVGERFRWRPRVSAGS